MVGNGILSPILAANKVIRRDDYLDHFKQLLGSVDTTNGELMKELN